MLATLPGEPMPALIPIVGFRVARMHTKLEEEGDSRAHNTEVVLDKCASTKISDPRMRKGIYTMHGGKNLLKMEKVPRRS